MAPLATYFSKSKLMARLQSHQGVRFHKKEDVIGDLEVPDDILFFEETDTLVRLKPSLDEMSLRISLDFEKYTAKAAV